MFGLRFHRSTHSRGRSRPFSRRIKGINSYDPKENSSRCLNDTTISLAMATATRVAGDKEGDGGKSDDDNTPISLAMVTAMRVAGDKECDGGKSDGDDEKGCGRATAAATRAVGDEEGDGEGGKS